MKVLVLNRGVPEVAIVRKEGNVWIGSCNGRVGEGDTSEECADSLTIPRPWRKANASE